ncbi:hypothetical protein V1517DRAFT_329541 [Lipomyces orientalis]|uniref:Uncharacterized protein n=1 Tax=Lipomyces orientalis TaxID=1233043 RepID=A0ACC3TI97_9ASCO
MSTLSPRTIICPLRTASCFFVLILALVGLFFQYLNGCCSHGSEPRMASEAIRPKWTNPPRAFDGSFLISKARTFSGKYNHSSVTFKLIQPQLNVIFQLLVQLGDPNLNNEGQCFLALFVAIFETAIRSFFWRSYRARQQCYSQNLR